MTFAKLSNEHFTPNQSINDALNEMIGGFPEPSRSRMRRKILHDIEALHRHQTDDADAAARHTFREFIVGWQLFQRGFNLEYDHEIGDQTPDWCDEPKKLAVEVFTCERGGTSDVVKRLVSGVSDKVGKYGRTIAANDLHFVVGVHGDFYSGLDDIDAEDAAANGRLFGAGPDLSGVIFFAETTVIPVPKADGTRGRKQLYRFRYFPNPGATRPIDLTDACSKCS